jgi:hypothetical protein
VKTGTKWAIGVGAGIVALLVTFGIIEEVKAAPAVPPAPPPPPPDTLQSGNRYRLDVACPFPIPLLPPAGSVSAVAGLLGVSGVSIVSYAPAADSKSFSVVFDYVGATMPLPPIQAGGGTACTTKLTWVSATPAGGIQTGNTGISTGTVNGLGALQNPNLPLGPYKELSPPFRLLNNETYLYELPPQPNMTLASIPLPQGIAVMQRWDQTQPAPSGWPSSGTGLWRMVITFSRSNGQPYNVPALSGARLWAVSGGQA